jgi:ribosomal protein S19
MHLHLCLKKKKKKKKVKAKIDSIKTAKRRSIILAKLLQRWMPE